MASIEMFSTARWVVSCRGVALLSVLIVHLFDLICVALSLLQAMMRTSK